MVNFASCNRSTLFPCSAHYLKLPENARQLVLRLCLIWFFAIFGGAMLQATVPLLLKDMVGISSAASYQGLLTATTATSGLLFCSALGYLSDRIGRLAILIPWCILFALGPLCALLAEYTGNVFWLMLGRIPALAIPMTLLFALTSDFAHGKTLLQVHGYIGTAFALALLFGSGLSAVIGKLMSRTAVFWVAFGSCLMGVLLAIRTPKNLVDEVVEEFAFERLKLSEEDPGSPSIQVPASPTTAIKNNTPSSYRHAVGVVYKDPLLLCTLFAFAVLRAGNVNTFFMFVLYANFRLGWGLTETSFALGFLGALAVIWQSIGVKFVVDRLRDTHVINLLLFLLLGYPLAMVGYGSVTTNEGMYWVVFLGSITSISPAIFTAKITTLSSQDGIAGSALGIVGSMTCFLELPASYFFSQVLAYTVRTFDRHDGMAGLPFYLNGAFYFLAFILIAIGDICFAKNREGWRAHSQPTVKEGEKSTVAI